MYKGLCLSAKRCFRARESALQLLCEAVRALGVRPQSARNNFYFFFCFFVALFFAAPLAASALFLRV